MLCVDEMGPVAAKTYPAPRWADAGARPKVTPDYGRRGKSWVLGALEPRTGQSLTLCSDKRDSASFVELLNAIVTTWSEGELILILDNLSTHKTIDVLLWALLQPRVRFLFQPTYAPWLNLIEPWWKTLRALALKGRCFADHEAVRLAIDQATDYWNEHRHPYTWRKAA